MPRPKKTLACGEMQDACLAVYEASKTKSEGEEKA